MPTLDFSLQLVSPAFIAGAMEKKADTNLRTKDGSIPQHRIIDDEGLRVPSLRGVLRFWFRAKEIGANLQEVAGREARVFGSTDIGQGLRFIPTRSTNLHAMEIGAENDLIRGGEARAYLGYGPLNYVPEHRRVTSRNKSTYRDAFREGAEFHFRAIGSISQLDELKRCLLLLHLFGGVGSRSRRAWGSVAVTGDFIPKLKANESLKNWLERALSLVWADHVKPSHESNLPKYSAFHANTEIRISQSIGTYRKAMEEFFEQFLAARLWRTGTRPRSTVAQNDHDWEMRDSAGVDVKDVPLRLAFGMPYFPQSREHNWKIQYFGYSANAKNSGRLEQIDRRASPLFLKVFRGPDQNLYAVALFLRAEFFGGRKVEIGQDQKGMKQPFPGWKAVEDFMNCSKWQKVNIP